MLMLVDVIFPGWVPLAYLAVSADIPGWVTAHDKALYPFETLVGGHLTRLGTGADVEVQQEYIQDLRTETTVGLSDPAVLGAAFDPGTGRPSGSCPAGWTAWGPRTCSRTRTPGRWPRPCGSTTAISAPSASAPERASQAGQSRSARQTSARTARCSGVIRSRKDSRTRRRCSLAALRNSRQPSGVAVAVLARWSPLSVARWTRPRRSIRSTNRLRPLGVR